MSTIAHPMTCSCCADLLNGHFDRRLFLKLVDSEAEAIAAMPEILAYDRRSVRRRFEERFAATRMAKDYVTTYRKLLAKRARAEDEQTAWTRQLTLKNENGLTAHVD